MSRIYNDDTDLFDQYGLLRDGFRYRVPPGLRLRPPGIEATITGQQPLATTNKDQTK